MDDPRIGTTLGGYEIGSLLGRGGMGVVYLATDTKLGRRVALKVLAPELSGDEGFRTRFIRESQMAAATDHPNIIPVYDAGETDGVLFLAMRYVDGTDLREVIKAHGQLEIGRAVSIVSQVGSALDAAHASGLIHRDVKPANVLLTTLGSSGESLDHVYLTDFGLTKRSDSRSQLTETGAFMGTVDYMSPEQIEGKQVDGRTDLYALGCLLYECLTGVVPYDRDSDVAVMYAHMMDERPDASGLRSELPKELDRVIAKAMSRDAADRFPTAAAMISEVRRALGMSDSHSTVRSAPPTGRTDRRSESRRPSASRVGVLALVGLLAMGAIGYALTRAEGQQPTDDNAGTSPDDGGSGTPGGVPWHPAPDDTLQMQLLGGIDTSYEADIYLTDMFDTPPPVIQEITATAKALCYVSAGVREEWRPDADEFPSELLGNNVEGSKEERWLDIRALDAVRPIMSERVIECADKGFDGVAFANLDGYDNDSGFELDKTDQVAFNTLLGELAHENGLTAGMINAPELAEELEPQFDFALSTGCYEFDECERFRAFLNAGKPVFVIEFELQADELCDRAEADGFTAQLKRYNLGAWRDACWE